MDVYGPLERTAAGHRFIQVITDRFTKLVRAIMMDGTSALDCASAVLDYGVGACEVSGSWVDALLYSRAV